MTISTWSFGDLPIFGFDVIVADPPWDFQNFVCTLGNPRNRPLPSSFDGIARDHSRKPDEFYEIVTNHTPGAARCDLFSRETREGFIGWGNEHGKFDAAQSSQRCSQ